MGHLPGPRLGRPRRQAILSLVPPGDIVVDVGCDHGYVTDALGAIGVERFPHRLPARRAGPRVICDGLGCFARVDVAILTGLGAAEIARILEAGPTPGIAVLHAPDRPGWLRTWCAAHGWRIDAERLAPEHGHFAQVLRVVPGVEPHQGLLLEFGPLLKDDPLFPDHVADRTRWWTRQLARTEGRDDAKAAQARAWVDFLQGLTSG